MPRDKSLAVWKRKKSEVETRIRELEALREETRVWLATASDNRKQLLWHSRNYKQFSQSSRETLRAVIPETARKLDHARRELAEINARISTLEQERIKVVPLAVALGIMLLLGLGALFIGMDSDTSITGLVVSDETGYTTMGLFNDTLDSATVPETPPLTIKKTKTVQEIIQETNITIEKDKVKEIKQIGYSAVEVTFEDWKYSKGLIIHKPSFNGKTFKEAVPLVEKDEFTYTSTFEETTVDIKFDQPGLSILAARFNQSKSSTEDSWKIAYNYLLPSEDYVNRIRISSSSPITITDSSIAKMETGKLSVDFAAERANNYDILVLQAAPRIVYVYLTKNYTEEGKTVNDEIIVDPTLTIGSGVIMTVCGDVQNYDLVDIQSTGTMTICRVNISAPATSGWVNFSLGYFGNFSIDVNGRVSGEIAGGDGGASCSGNTCTSTAGGNGTGNNGTASTVPNGGGGSGAARSSNANSAGGGGGGFGGDGGAGGISALGTKSTGGFSYGSPAGERLFTGSGGGGESGDLTSGVNIDGGSAGGGGLKVTAGAGGWIGIRGTINVSAMNASNGDAADDSGAGGGSGGHIILKAGTIMFSSATIRADGGNGGNSSGVDDSCGGGGGAGGRILYVFETISSNSLTNSTRYGERGTGGDAACDAPTDPLNSTNGANGTIFYNSTVFNKMPITYLVAPANLTINTTDSTPEFFFNVSDDLLTEQRLNCTLWLQNDVLLGSAKPFGTNESVYNGTNTVITANATLSNGPYQWWINCTEGLLYSNGLTNVSESRNITINVAGAADAIPPNVTVLTPTLNSLFDPSVTIEIGANITDSSIINMTFVNLTYPNTSIQKLFLSNSTDNPSRFNLTFTLPMESGVYNLTFFANDSLNNINYTEKTSFTIRNLAPVISNATVMHNTSTISIIEGTYRQLNFTFIAVDANGNGDLDNSTAKLEINITKYLGDGTTLSTVRSNNSCAANNTIGNTGINYSCQINLWYFDSGGAWTINASIKDRNTTQSENRTTQFLVATTTAMIMSPTSLTWPTLELGTTNRTSNSTPITINNTGNKDISAGGITVSGSNLQGLTTLSQFIMAQNFSVHAINSSSCTGGNCLECNGTQLMNSTSGTANPQTLAIANMTAGNNTINFQNQTSGQENLFFCLRTVPSDISRQVYDTSGQHTALWTISIS